MATPTVANGVKIAGLGLALTGVAVWWKGRHVRLGQALIGLGGLTMVFGPKAEQQPPPKSKEKKRAKTAPPQLSEKELSALCGLIANLPGLLNKAPRQKRAAHVGFLRDGRLAIPQIKNALHTANGESKGKFLIALLDVYTLHDVLPAFNAEEIRAGVKGQESLPNAFTFALASKNPSQRRPFSELLDFLPDPAENLRQLGTYLMTTALVAPQLAHYAENLSSTGPWPEGLDVFREQMESLRDNRPEAHAETFELCIEMMDKLQFGENVSNPKCAEAVKTVYDAIVAVAPEGFQWQDCETAAYRDRADFDIQFIHSLPSWPQEKLHGGFFAEKIPPLAFVFLSEDDQEEVLGQAGDHATVLSEVRGKQ